MSDINYNSIRMRFQGRRLYNMEKSKMINRGKKIVAVALSFMMMIPVAFSQTTVTKAAGAGTTTAVPTPDKVLKLTVEKNTADKKLSLERGQEVSLTLTATQELNVEEIVGELSFVDTTKNEAVKCFSMTGVEADGWNTGYDTGASLISLRTANTKNVKANGTIATIKLKVTQSVDSVTATYKITSFKASTVGANAAPIQGTGADSITCKMDNELAKTRGVTLDTISSLTQKLYSFDTQKLKSFSIPVKITANTGFNAMKLQVTYDSSKLSYRSYTVSPKALVYLNCMTEYQGVDSTGNGFVTISFVGTDDTNITGDFVSLNFEVSARAQAGDTAEITCAVAELENASESANLTSNTSKCTVTFKEGSKRGDVNQDGQINLIDVTYALQFYNGVRNLTTEQQALADVNGDKKVTLVDVLMLLKKCNGENINFS